MTICDSVKLLKGFATSFMRYHRQMRPMYFNTNQTKKPEGLNSGRNRRRVVQGFFHTGQEQHETDTDIGDGMDISRTTINVGQVPGLGISASQCEHAIPGVHLLSIKGPIAVSKLTHLSYVHAERPMY